MSLLKMVSLHLTRSRHVPVLCKRRQEEARHTHTKKTWGKKKKRNLVQKWLIIPRPEWSTIIPYSELFYLPMELMKESRIWMLWKIFYCQMECKNQWLQGNFVRFETSWPGALQLFNKTEISSQSFLPNFFPFSTILQSVLGHLVPLWEGDRVSSHEARLFGKPAMKKLCSALHCCLVGELQDVSATGLPIPNPVQYEQWLYVTYCSGQLITS